MKKVQKTLTGALATVMAAGMVPVTAMAATNFDALHKAAYDAVKVAQETKTQKDINAARALVAEYKAAIIAEGKDGLLVNINTFSELLDVVQGPVLSEIVKAVLAMQEAGTATQAEINAVRTLMEGDQADDSDNLPASLTEAVKTWSSAVDVFQKELLDAAVAAVKTAETEKTTSAIEAAKVLVDDLSTAVREGIKNVATTLQERLDSITVYDLNIKSYTVTRYGIDVVFEALAETITDVTLEVKNSKGEIVPVKTVSKILEGRTKATFSFTTPVFSSTLEGVWTVNGVEMDLTEAKLVGEVEKNKNVDEKLTTALIKLQTEGYISRLKLDDDKVINSTALAAYKTEFAKKTLKTAEDVQTIIDEVNETIDVAVDEAKKVDSIVNAKNDKAKLEALEENGIKRVNEEWIAKYNFSANKTLKAIQTTVDTYNETTIKAKVDGLATGLDLEAIDVAILLVEDFINPETKGSKEDVKLQDELLAVLEIRNVLINAVTADNTSALKANLQKLASLTKEFDYDKIIIESNMLAYRDALEVAANDAKDEITELVDILDSVNADVIDDKVGKVNAAFVVVDNETKKYTDAQKDTIMKAFAELELATAKKTGNDKFEVKSVVEANLEAYQTTVSVAGDVAEINNAIKTVNEAPLKVALDAVKAASTADELLTALKNLGVNNIVDENKVAYKAEDFATAATFINGKESEAVKKVQTLVNSVNSKEVVLKSNELSVVKSELVKFALNENANDFANLKDAVKSDIVELLIAQISTGKIETMTNNELKQAINVSLIEEHKEALANLNGEVLITQVRDQLNKISAEFKALAPEVKLVVAEEFIAARPTDKDGLVDFENFTQVREVIASVIK